MDSNKSNPTIERLIADYEQGYLSEEILARAIANRADQAGLNAVGLTMELMLIVLGAIALGTATVARQPLQPQGVPSAQQLMEQAAPSPNFPGKFTRPTALAPISSKMGMRFHPVHKFWRLHAGLDIAVPIGSSVLAPADGVVSVAGWAGECGIKIQLNHGGGWDTRYCHNSKALVTVGQRVKRGDAIALSGNTGGYSTGPHLHFEIRKDGNPLDPLKFVSY
ncbi:MAG TPA: M23 family metallopeptidase [Kamptonema sp.]|nr:M23 family metallopeptidase [Kamptonema sp.]